ncbi:MAG: hypothetical protein ACREK3_09310 [Gemmatimonadota bacterium]
MHNSFGRTWAIHLGDGVLYFGWTDSLAVGISDLEGRRVGGFRDRPEPVPVTEADIERAVTDLEESDRPAAATGHIDKSRSNQREC